MKKRIASLLLALVLCLGLTVSAAAAEEQKITVGDKTYGALLEAIMSETKADSVTARLDSDMTLTAAVVIGSSDYNGQFKEPMTVTAKNVTIDLNGHTLTAAKDCAVFEVQKDYTLTIVDGSEAKTGKLDCGAEEAVVVAEGATYNALPAAEEKPAEEKPAEEKPAEEKPAANPFTDVAETAYYYEAVLWAVENNITTGKTETTFVPGETCTTAHILTFLWRANGSPEPTITENPFTDVKETDYFYKAALWAAEKELVSGNVFTPSAPCTRGQTMLYLYLLAGSPDAELSTFSDVPTDSVYSKAISWAVTQGITTGKTETTFAPDEICTRGHIVTFLYRADKAATEAASATATETPA